MAGIDGNFASGLSSGLSKAIQAVGLGGDVKQQAQMQAGLIGAQTAKYGVDANEGARLSALRQDPGFLKSISALYGPGAAAAFQAGGDADKFGGNAMDMQKYQFRDRVLNNIGDPGTDPTKINMGTSAVEGKTYEPFRPVGDTGYTVNQGTGAVGVGNPGMAGLFQQGQQAQNNLRTAQAGQAAQSGRNFDATRGVVIDTRTGTAMPVTLPDGAPLPPSAASYNKAYDENKAKDMVAAEDSIRKAGMQAPATLGNLSEMERLVGNYDGGRLTGMAMSAASIGNSLGIPIDPKLGDKQAAEALFNEFALKLKNAGGANQLPGALSDRDLAFLQATSPQLTQSAAGRQSIIDRHRKLAMRDQQVANMAQAYKERNGGRLDDGFFTRLSAWSQRNPLFSEPAHGNP
ncbi:hypothetical protein [Herbaspirillum chlorophenolicum]|uniref:hypothetical protein n=1 Tax=Herbaspirillum chlorophenolicum TaxID=211589 RepID=UPI000B178B51|nr:hypothetical protein [Herbaspirillum chlorophenolicum]